AAAGAAARTFQFRESGMLYAPSGYIGGTLPLVGEGTAKIIGGGTSADLLTVTQYPINNAGCTPIVGHDTQAISITSARSDVVQWTARGTACPQSAGSAGITVSGHVTITRGYGRYVGMRGSGTITGADTVVSGNGGPLLKLAYHFVVRATIKPM
ncbi:MAG: hypothetical protein ACRDG4_11515, partial [Chloroflexota bacterium]